MAQQTTSAVASTPVTLGVDLGSHYIRLGTVDRQHQVAAFRREHYTEAATSDARQLTDQILRVVGQMFDEHPATSNIAAIGVAIPGLVHQPAQEILSVSHLPALGEIDLRGEFQRAFGVPVYFENNAKAAAYAEMNLGVARGIPDWLYFHLGANVSAGLVLDGKMQHGRSGLAGAIGRMNIYVEHLATSMQLEDLVSADNIVRRTRDRLHRDKTSSLSRLAAMGGFTYDDIIAAAHSGDDLARMMIYRTGAFIAIAISDVISLLNLSMVAVGGALTARQFLVDAIAREVRHRTPAHFIDDCRIVAATVGVEATVIGAALVAERQLASA